MDSAVLDAGESIQIPIVFTPNDTQAFSETLKFEVNGKQIVSLPVKGRGVPLELSLENDADNKVTFSPSLVGAVTRRTVNLVNRSRLPLTFTLSKTSNPAGTEFLSFTPMGVVADLPPKGVCPIELTFAPTRRE